MKTKEVKMEITELLEKGDIIEIKLLDRIYAEIPNHFGDCHPPRIGDWATYKRDVVVGGIFSYFQGLYKVVETRNDGGSSPHARDPFPNGYHVFCEQVGNNRVEINFYQTGCFTVMIKNPRIISRTTKLNKEDVE